MNFSIDNGLSRCKAAAVAAALLLCCSGAATAGVDDAWNASPATQDTSWAQAYAAPVNPSNSGGGGGEAVFYSISAGWGQTKSQQLVSTQTHHCALSISQSRNDNHVNTDVYQSGGYWFLRLYSVGNAGVVNGGAVCWPR